MLFYENEQFRQVGIPETLMKIKHANHCIIRQLLGLSYINIRIQVYMATSHRFILFSLLVCLSLSYLELHANRLELREGLGNGPVKCITKELDKQLDASRKAEKDKQKAKKKKKNKSEDDEEDEDQEEQINDDDIDEQRNYREICYEKDISYSLPMLLNKHLYLISLDTTIPISWFKGTHCNIEASSKKCSLVQTNLKEKISKIFAKKQSKVHHTKDQYAMIEGSSELVKGIQQRGQKLTFVTKDSSRLTNLFEIMMLGFYMKEETDHLELESTNFINATEISQNLNYLCDGGISLRFDDMSESSFLKQLLAYQKATQSYVSIATDVYGGAVIAIGQLASKYTKNGFGGIEWVPVETDQNFGKLPIITDIFIDSQGPKGYGAEIKDREYPTVVSLSASYIGLPKQLTQGWIARFDKRFGCGVDEVTRYIQCKSLKGLEPQTVTITFEFSGKKISFQLSELIIGKIKSKTIINVKETILDKYIILGEPFFVKYFVAFDYKSNRVGFTQKMDKSEKDFINVVTLIRFICFVFLFGCVFILCFLPIKKVIDTFKSRTKYGIQDGKNTGQTRRLKAYAPIQENPYDEINGKVKQAFANQDLH